MRYGEHCLWMELNTVLDAYRAGLVPRSAYLAAFDAWHQDKRAANRRGVARTYGDPVRTPKGERRVRVIEMKYWYVTRPAEKALRWVAWHLPRSVVMWAYLRIGAHATTGKWSGTVVPDLTMMEALKRWDEE